jgi:hypothetical protein
MGAVDISRVSFERHLQRLVDEPRETGSWQDCAHFEDRW